MPRDGLVERQELQTAIERYSWYHSIEVAPGLSTPGIGSLVPLVEHLRSVVRGLDLAGKRVLDVGTRDGALAFEAERAGARQVIGIDNDLSRGAVEVLIPHFGSAVEMREINLLDLTPDRFGQFDVVLCCGVLYHLRYPFWGLRAVGSVVVNGGLLVLETGLLVDDNTRALLYCPTGQESPYESTAPTFFNAKGLRDSLGSLGFGVESIKYHKPLQYPSGVESIGYEKPLKYTSARRWKDALRLGFGRPAISRINRAVITCRKRDDLGSLDLLAYWDLTHDMHTTGHDRPN
jgi:SAM-dependent methyltransferase